MDFEINNMTSIIVLINEVILERMSILTKINRDILNLLEQCANTREFIEQLMNLYREIDKQIEMSNNCLLGVGNG